MQNPGYPNPLPLASLWSIATGARYQTQSASVLLAACAAAKLVMGEGGGNTTVADSAIDSIVVTNNSGSVLQPFTLVDGVVTVQLVARAGSSNSVMTALVGDSFQSSVGSGTYASSSLDQLNGAVVLIDPIAATSVRIPFGLERVSFLPNGVITIQVPLPPLPSAFSALRVTVDWDNSPGSIYSTRPLAAPNGFTFFVRYVVDVSIAVPVGSLQASKPVWKANNLLFWGAMGPDGCWSSSNDIAGLLAGHPISVPGIRTAMLPLFPGGVSLSTSFAHDSYWYAAPIFPDGFLVKNANFMNAQVTDSAHFSPLFPNHSGASIMTSSTVGPPNMSTLPV